MKKVQRCYKDTIFRRLVQIPENALALYNALNGTAYKDVGMLEFNTLENVIYMNVKNDVSFLITGSVNLYEHQSTVNPNMPLRDLVYVTDLFQKYIKDVSIYTSKRVKIPTPHFVVFYNGVDDYPEKMEQRLSDNFQVRVSEPELELRVLVININSGMNEELKDKCPFLKDYTILVDKIREYAEQIEIDAAVELAVTECIRENVMREFLMNNRAEVVRMCIYEFDEEREMKLIRQAERENGENKGKIAYIFELLEDLGKVPENLKAKILSEENVTNLSKIHKLAAKAESMEEFEREVVKL